MSYILVRMSLRTKKKKKYRAECVRLPFDLFHGIIYAYSVKRFAIIINDIWRKETQMMGQPISITIDLVLGVRQKVINLSHARYGAHHDKLTREKNCNNWLFACFTRSCQMVESCDILQCQVCLPLIFLTFPFTSIRRWSECTQKWTGILSSCARCIFAAETSAQNCIACGISFFSL